MKKTVTFFILSLLMVLLVGCSSSNSNSNSGSNSGSNNATNYTITFNSNGGSTVPSITRQSGTLVYAPMNPTATGYTFEGWYTTSSLTTKVSWPVTLNSNRTYYAGWKSNVTTTSITDSNFGTYFSATVKQTNISTSNSGTTLTFKIDVSSKSGVKSISSTIAVTFKVNVSYTYYNGRNTYSGSSYQTVTVYINSLSSQSKTVTVKLSHSGPLASHKVSSFTYYNVSGKITR